MIKNAILFSYYLFIYGKIVSKHRSWSSLLYEAFLCLPFKDRAPVILLYNYC